MARPKQYKYARDVGIQPGAAASEGSPTDGISDVKPSNLEEEGKPLAREKRGNANEKPRPNFASSFLLPGFCAGPPDDSSRRNIYGSPAFAQGLGARQVPRTKCAHIYLFNYPERHSCRIVSNKDSCCPFVTTKRLKGLLVIIILLAALLFEYV